METASYHFLSVTPGLCRTLVAPRARRTTAGLTDAQESQLRSTSRKHLARWHCIGALLYISFASSRACLLLLGTSTRLLRVSILLVIHSRTSRALNVTMSPPRKVT